MTNVLSVRSVFKNYSPASVRRSFLWAHRWLGLVCGIVVVLMGLTGSFNVFYREIDAALNPALFTPAGPEQSINLTEVVRVAAAADPAPIFAILAPDKVWPVWVVMHDHEGPKDSFKNLWTTMIDPSNGEVLGQRDYTNAPAFMIYRLHYTLLLYEWGGKQLVGVVGFVLLGLALSGLYSWWPKQGRFWRSVSIRRGVSPLRFFVDLHNTTGFWASTVLLAISVTGIGVVFPGVIRPVVGLLSGATPDPSPRIETPSPKGTPQLPPDEIMRIAQATKPTLSITVLNPPTKSNNAWHVRFRPDDADPALRSRGAIWLDPWSGAVVQDLTSDAMSAGDRYMTEQLWIHNGSTFGLYGRLLVFVTGFVPLALFITGGIMWLKKRSGKIKPSQSSAFWQ
jgi:uncharacterized iron-regulated membrane protein